MTQDEIIRMAREAGFEVDEGLFPFEAAEDKYIGTERTLERFAALVAAHEREAIMEIVNTIGGDFAVECAAAIRARNVDSVDTSPKRVEKTAKSIHDESTNPCQKSTELAEKDCGGAHHHRYAGSFGGLI